MRSDITPSGTLPAAGTMALSVPRPRSRRRSECLARHADTLDVLASEIRERAATALAIQIEVTAPRQASEAVRRTARNSVASTPSSDNAATAL